MSNLNDAKLSIKQGKFISPNNIPSLNDHHGHDVGTQANVPDKISDIY